jgi:hypothetical protein
MSKTRTNKVVAINYAAQVDRLGELNALIAPLADEISVIKDQLRASGYDVIEGQLYRCTVGETKDREYVDWQAVATAGIRKDRLAALVNKFTGFKQALGAVRCVAKVR